jgi:hypothetical protein
MKLYRVIFFFKNGKQPRKYRKVSRVGVLCAWLNKNGAGDWKYCNVYDQESKQFCERIYNLR